MNTRSFLVVLPLAAACLLGCNGNDTAKAPGGVGVDPLPPQMYPKIACLQGLDAYIVMGTAPRVETGPPMRVTCTLRTKTDFEEISVQYRYLFLDPAGVPLNNNPDWQYLRMPSRSECFFSGNALDKTAVDWRLEVRPAR